MATIGQRLGDARREKSLSIDDVAHETRIHAPMIQGIENDDFSFFPSVAYAKSFVRKYSEFLEVDVSDVMHALNSGVAVRLSENPLMGEMKTTIKKDRHFRFKRAGWRPGSRLWRTGKAPILLNCVLAVLIGAMAVFYLLGYNASSPEEARQEIAKGLRKAAPFIEEEEIPERPFPEQNVERPLLIATPVLDPAMLPGAAEVEVTEPSASAPAPEIEKPIVEFVLEEEPAPLPGDPRNSGLPLKPRVTPRLPLENDRSIAPVPPLRSADLSVMKEVKEEMPTPIQPLETDAIPAGSQRSAQETESSLRAPRPARSASPQSGDLRAVPVASRES